MKELPRPLTSAEAAVVSAGNGFAFDLLREVSRRKPGENVFVSPLSASLALGMTSNGARGRTRDEMVATLGFGALPQAEVNGAYRGLIDLLRGLDGRVQMHIANSVWYRQDYPFEQAFLADARRYYDAEVAALDFSSPSAARTINNWVSGATRGRITTIMEGARPDDVMHLVNALYFKGTWQTQFDRAKTTTEPFHAADGTARPVPMMRREGKIQYAAGPEYQAVELPYARGAFVMTLVLPAPGRSVDGLVASLDAAGWEALTGRLVETSGFTVGLPRFRLEHSHELNATLQALGMRAAFTPGGADFTGLSPLGRDLFITQVLQKTFVEVNEEGTEAAAATRVSIGPTSAPPSVVFNRPFVFAIRERFSGTILFVGKMAAPPAS
ncbi:MAG TPA: serpin family protein [Longimicrobiaceae bacterium]|nr:serpin family protein [Longimicrobiaceae bacterium]